MPWVFDRYAGTIDARGRAQAALHLPNSTAIVGLTVHTAFVTLDPRAPAGIRDISDTESVQVGR